MIDVFGDKIKSFFRKTASVERVETQNKLEKKMTNVQIRSQSIDRNIGSEFDDQEKKKKEKHKKFEGHKFDNINAMAY